jgi:hypothetical protein
MNATQDWIASWCLEHLRAVPVRELLSTRTMSSVVALELADGRSIVVKRRPDEEGRATSCVAVQLQLAERGFPCARPITRVTTVDGTATHAEEWMPGGTLMDADDQVAARCSATLLADLTARIEAIAARPPVPNPEWVRWDHTDDGNWPAYAWHDARAARIPLPTWLEELARRTRARLCSIELPRIIGHADWEAQNLRWIDRAPYVVHDWDSLAYLSEAAIAGAASGAFASGATPSLVSLESSKAFLDAYETARRRRFSPDETSVAWAASLWPALHNARGEVLYEQPRVAFAAVASQAEDRLALARA